MSVHLLAILLCLASSGAPSQSDPPPSTGVRILEHDAFEAALNAIVAAHPDLAHLERLGESREGRDVLALRLSAVEDPDRAPALLLIGNLEGPRLFEGGVVLDHAERMAADYADDEQVRALLDETVVWFVPRANPDPAQWHFKPVDQEQWATRVGVDDDRDGLSGENPVEDLNKDGRITRMRVRDPEGTWTEDPTDPRVLIEADRAKGQVGRWKVYPESRDTDGDGDYGEDQPGDTRMDRNFAAGWEQNAAHAGRFPTDEPEARALCDFVLAHPNIVLVVAYDGLDNLVEKPERVADDAEPVKRVPPPGVLASDADLIEELGRRYREATEDESKGSGQRGGTFTNWCYDHRGILCLETVLWNIPTEAPAEEEEAGEEASAGDTGEEAADPDEPSGDAGGAGERRAGPEAEPSLDAQHLRWIDGAGEDWRFVPWTPFEHPQLGPVEIGGFAPNAKLVPPRDDWQRISDVHYDWFRGLGALLPRLTIASFTREALGESLWSVELVLANDSFLPLLSRSARRTRTLRPARVRLDLGEGGRIVAGRAQELVSDLPGSGGWHEARWIVQVDDGARIRVLVDSDHAGVLSQAAEVKQ